MRFTEYVVLENVDRAIDPLGFRRPAGALQDMLFPQFTVLTLHPVYLGAQCSILQHLGEHTIDTRQFSQRFRALEIYWGIANASVDAPIINITKYQRLRGQATISLGAIDKQNSIFQRLSYGTLGHYTSAAREWGLVESNGRTLSTLGHRLADAFSSRTKSLPFRDALSRWQDNHAVSPDDFEQAGQIYGLDALPSQKESNLWRDLIEMWCRNNRRVESLWHAPPRQQALEQGFADAGAYQSFWTDLRQQYPGLSTELAAIYRFERLAAITQFVLDLRIAALEYKGNFRDALPAGANAIAAAATTLAGEYVAAPAFRDSRRLFSSVAQSSGDFTSLTRGVVDHHIEHHTAKGTSPIVNDKELLVTDRVNSDRVKEALTMLDSVSGNPLTQIDGLQHIYRRQWHFEKCRRWHDWAHPQSESMQ